ncbi:hypothetical protein EMIHUDRAFT_310446 [Emiliania huxleyi CCMP1516]|uniref:Uncharacterized protein n=2 Tax=Emiliania huxleyi TaxID=2903 RepID=A0A0D3JE28_EMIH1|nr:hypothetical protein EMIHUDRAFT_310446 [Emiliania huxleyi CCMP1516]EOD21763.1 hypothetical protein EMIHUDRAFT_310446 [Emiliania huxleyi CCMP1516]|eukprot:XP_005774192.1 hypothetical protein EMIHUDRAFT_310446 [Emiliania huxleyi CCMP1516]
MPSPASPTVPAPFASGLPMPSVTQSRSYSSPPSLLRPLPLPLPLLRVAQPRSYSWRLPL